MDDTRIMEGLAGLGKGPDSFMDRFRVTVNGSSEYRVLQPVWDLRYGWESQLVSPLFPIVMSISAYFMMLLPWMIIDLYGAEWKWIQRYKIQPDKQVTWPQMRQAIALTMWNQVLYILPVSVAQVVWTPDITLPAIAPGLWEFLWQQYAALVIFDAEYGAWHFIHHKIRFLYRNVHSVHHEYHAPSVWVSQYLHPWELICIGVFTVTAPWYFGAHPMTEWSFVLMTIAVSVESHIGFDLPFMPHRWAPFWGGVTKHDMHHQRPRTNYQPFFNQFDRLFNTECPGQLAGGYKPKELMDWERNEKSAVQVRIKEKRQREEKFLIQKKIDARLTAMREQIMTTD